jgi:hypothetical protein
MFSTIGAAPATSPHRQRRWRVSILLAFVAFLSISSAAHAQAGLTLEGEFLFSSVPHNPLTTLIAEEHCDPTGVSTLRITATGIALGPYPGVFEETAVFTLSAPISADSLRREVLQADARFRIVSGETEITGTKQLAERRPPFGTIETTGECQIVRVTGIGAQGPCDQTLISASALVEYSATIRTPTETFSDSGFAESSGGIMRINNCVDVSGEVFFSGALSNNFILSFSSPTPGRVTGGGQIREDVAGSGVTFGLTAESRPDGLTSGTCSVIDHEAGTDIRCLDVIAFTRIGTTVTFSGRALVDGAETTYRINVIDNGEPGTADTFAIETDTGYTAVGTLSTGNIVIHDDPGGAASG